MAEFERECSVCGHVHVGARSALARLTECERCGAQLPQGMRVHVAGAGASAGAAVSAAQGAGERWTLSCPHCGHVHEGTREQVSSLWYCEACGERLEGSQARPAASAAPAAAESAGGPRPQASGGRAPFSPASLRLRLADADVSEELPVEGDGGEGMFGRLTAQSPTLASLRTLSRRQFAYRCRDDGSLEVTNLSQYGTRVAGQLLSEPGESAVARPPAVIEMAGMTFTLERM